MKPSDMTNEELANELEKPLVGSRIVIEAAARLRKIDTYCAINERQDIDNEKLRANLKVAEDALGESRVAVCHICNLKHTCGHGTSKFDPCCIRKDIDGALAAIRGERN